MSDPSADDKREEKSAELFDLTTDALIERVRTGKATAAELAVAIKHLANNGITAATLKHKGMAKLTDKVIHSLPKFVGDEGPDEEVRLAQ